VLLALGPALGVMAESARERSRGRTAAILEKAFPARVPDHVIGAEKARWEWWERRAWSIEHTEEQVLDCEAGDQTIRLKCMRPGCGNTWEVRWECKRAFLCKHCREVEQKKRRARVARQDQALRDKGFYARRMLTLTAPHVGNAQQRITRVLDAMPPFERWIRRYLGAELAGYWSSFELTGGSDGQGHPHWHMLLASSFLPQPVAAARWAAELIRAGGSEVEQAMPSKPLGELVTWVREHVFAPTARREACLELARCTQIPWCVDGANPPRRLPDELGAVYIARRSEWAERMAWVRGKVARTRHFSRVVGDYLRGVDWWMLPHQDIAAMVRTARTPVAVVDARFDAEKPLAELVKYTIKTEGTDKVDPWLHGVAYCTTRDPKGRRLFRTSKFAAEPKREGKGCPMCQSHAIRMDTMRPDVIDDFWQFVRDWRRELHEREADRIAIARATRPDMSKPGPILRLVAPPRPPKQLRFSDLYYA
jgi:hypothetical protein